MAHRRRQMQGETRLLMEYLAQAYPSAVWLTNVKLGDAVPAKTGMALSPEELRMLQVYRRYADAVVLTLAELVVIEASVFRSHEKVGQLLQYLELVRHTSELRPFLNRRVVGELLTAQPDALAEKVARDHGIRYTVFKPTWLGEFLSIYPGRTRRAPFPGTVDI